ncbi:hypothetical protein CAPTEDRAFT_139082 [Capitella teleta]|uniref:Hexosyltransferase n=1 Tax=Capitella teleta TaxID=283909 RepID=R7UT07_CAPTE|nr:hypothetical protein CAPTEDRAFT_139082 [Capitella teleta]|eukprot:ELU09624.1 hypothetical protein CAPTEDRAFT_139082 [Capitella teleta]
MAKKFADHPPEEDGLQNRIDQYEDHIKLKLQESEILNGIPMNNEFEVAPFTRFTSTRLYLVDPGLGKRVVEKPIGHKKKELMEVVDFSLDHLNLGREPKMKMFEATDFLEGIYRTEPSMGTHYELIFRDIDVQTLQHYRKVTLTRPYAPLHLMDHRALSSEKKMINLILPLSGRIEKFTLFMERFIRICIRMDKRVYLTIVYFGEEGLDQVKAVINKVSKAYDFNYIKLVTINEPFSRGRGLQVGAQSWSFGDAIMFLCDVDIVFSTDFLERCRLNTDPGVRIYYPIVFSLYNPSVAYSLQGMAMPKESEQLVISKNTGFWRDFGFGMACMYRSDFIAIKGFDEKIDGWGLEDVYLYRKFVRSPLMVVRATDPGIFHQWHEKICDPSLPSDQYRGCIRSKALNEASHAQLGMLAFKEEIDNHKAIIKDR